MKTLTLTDEQLQQLRLWLTGLAYLLPDCAVPEQKMLAEFDELISQAELK